MIGRALRLVLASLAISGGSPAWSQSEVTLAPGAWGMVDLNWVGSRPLAFSMELHERTWGLFEEQALAIVRPAVHWAFAPQFEGALGGTWVGSSTGGVEWNGWEQLAMKGGDERWKWAVRIRQEQRRIASSDLTQRLNRLRIRVAATHPLSWGNGSWYASGFVEWWGDQDGDYRFTSCSRTWHAVGVGRRFDSGWRVQLTALHQRDALDAGWRVSPIGQVSVHRTWQAH